MKKTALLILKKIDNKNHYLLVKDNLKLINKSSELYSAFNNDSTEYSLDNAIKSFHVNTFNKHKDSTFEDIECYIDDKYNYRMYFKFIDDIDTETINELRNFVNSISIEEGQYTISENNSEDLKWFNLKDIINNKDNFDKLFFKIFLKMIKNNLI